MISTTGGSLVSSLAGELSLAGEFSLAGERSLAGEPSLGGVVKADGTSGTLGEAALLLDKQTVRYQQRKSTNACLTAGSKPYTYAGGCAGGCFEE